MQQGTARQSSARAASASAVAAGAVGEEFYGSERAQMTAVPVGYLSSLGPFAAATAAAVAAAATSGGRPGLDPYGLLAQQQMGGTLEPFSALMCGGGVMPRLLNPHAAAAAMAASRVAAADAAFVGDLDLAGRGMLGGMYPFLGPGAWPATAAAAHEGLEADGSGGGTGASMCSDGCAKLRSLSLFAFLIASMLYGTASMPRHHGLSHGKAMYDIWSLHLMMDCTSTHAMAMMTRPLSPLLRRSFCCW